MRIAGLLAIGTVIGVGARPTGCSGPLGREVTVRWTPPSGPGLAGVELHGCARWRELGPDELGVIPGWGACLVHAWRKDGALRIESAPVQITGDSDAMFVTFDLPEGPIGGMGAQVRATGDAVRIDRVITGSPADVAGLGPGDIVLAVDGTATAAMSTPRFIRTVTGVPGTPVSLLVAPNGDVDLASEINLVRERIIDPW